MRFTLRQLSYFVAAGESKSITVASERIHISQASISSAISQLEAEFGIQLFFRHHAQGLSLTPAGERIFGAACELLHQANAMHDLADEITSTVAGPLRIGAFLTLAPLVLPELCADFGRLYPNVSIEMREDDEAELAMKVRRAEIDVAITYEQHAPDLEFEELAVLPTYVLLPADHSMANARALKLKELVDLPFVLLDLPVSRDYFRSLFERQGLRLRIFARSEQPETVRSLVGNGIGFSLLTARPINRNSLNGKPLVYLPLDDELPPMKLGLLTSKSIKKTRSVTSFEEHCRRIITSSHIPGMADL